MNMLISKKIIVSTILVIMIITIITPVFAATTIGTTSTSNNSLLGGMLGLFFNLITKGTEATVKIGSSILQSLLKGNTTAPVVEKDKSTSTVSKNITSTGKYKYTMSNDIKKILGNFTDEDYKLFIRIIYNEAGNDEVGAKYTAATLINMVQYYYPGESISYAINHACIPFIRGNFASFETAYKCVATKNAVQYALNGNDPTTSIKNYKGGNGAINWYTDFNKKKFVGKGKAVQLKDSSNVVKAIALGTTLKYNSYFTGTSNLKITGLH